MSKKTSTKKRTPGSLHPACCVRACIPLEQWLATNRAPVTVGFYNGIPLKAAGRKQTRDEHGNPMVTFYFKKAHNGAAEGRSPQGGETT